MLCSIWSIAKFLVENTARIYTSCKIPWEIRLRTLCYFGLSITILNTSIIRTRFRLWYLAKTINMVKVDYFKKQNSFPFICPVLDFGIEHRVRSQFQYSSVGDSLFWYHHYLQKICKGVYSLLHYCTLENLAYPKWVFCKLTLDRFKQELLTGKSILLERKAA